MSDKKLAQFIVGIKNKQGEIIGTGFVIAKGVIATCGHVVQSISAQVNDKVVVTFSKLDADYSTTVNVCKTEDDKDIAILIGSQSLPEQAQPAILCRANDVDIPIEFSTVGYRKWGKRSGIPIKGKVLAFAWETGGKPPLILETIWDNKRGISGAPLYLPEINRVIGFITSCLEEKKRAFANPAEVIQEVWPDLEFQLPLSSKKVASQKFKSKPIPRFLHYRSNRLKQEGKLAEEIKKHQQTDKPLLCLIHGEQSECSDMFLECLVEEKRLSKVIAPEYDTDIYGIRRYDFSCGDFNSVDELHQNMKFSLGDEVCGDMQASRKKIARAVGCEPGIVMLATNLCSDAAQAMSNKTDVIHGFIKFWADWYNPNPPDRNHLLLVCLSFNYQTENLLQRLFRKKSTNQKLRSTFETLEFKKFKVSGTVLPELKSIGKNEVKDWANMYAHRFCDIDILIQEIHKIYATKDKIPMQLLADQLKQILKKYGYNY